MKGLRLLAAVLVCLATMAILSGPTPADSVGGIAGTWFGTLYIGPLECRLVFRISEKDGKLAATFDSLDLGEKDVAVDTVEFKAGKLKLEVKKVKALLEGQANRDVSAIEGQWKQKPVSGTLTLRRVEKVPVLVRPQHPKKPYPYREQEVTFKNAKAGIRFAGILTMPQGKGPFPAAVLITGYAPQDRDETMFGHKHFWVLADHLTRKGIAVLRIDDRGVGGSGGDTWTATLEDLAGDALSAVAYLKGVKEIDPKQIGLIGHSQGGSVVPLAASQSADVAFIVLLAGPGMTGEELNYLNGPALLKLGGATARQIAVNRLHQEVLFRVLKEEKDDEKARRLLARRVAEKLASLPAGEKEEFKKLADAVEAHIELMLVPATRSFLSHDPRPSLRKVRVPVLALCGGKDLVVLPSESFSAIAAALKAAGNKDYTTKELPDLNHHFQTCKTGAISECAKIEETFAPSALKEISDWILKRTRRD